MTEENNSLVSESDQLLAESVESLFEDSTSGEEKQTIGSEDELVKEVEEPKEEASKEENEEETEINEEQEESTEEVADEEGIDTKEVDLNETLRGVFNKDYINLLGKVESPELRNELIDAGKLQRADLDRKRLELGESRKLVETLDEVVKESGLNYNRQQYNDVVKNYMNFDAQFSKDPKLALEQLAQSSNIDLKQMFTDNTPVQDEDDYRTPEEVTRDNKIAALEREIQLNKNQVKQQEQLSITEEINSFANSKDSDGNLKYPYFEKVKSTMGLLFQSNDSSMTMEKAYKKAILLDDELSSQRDADLLKRNELERKSAIEKAKKLKKQSVRSSKVNSFTKDPDKALEDIVNSSNIDWG
jgi:hypothetical protein